jgi:hypothetical protein
MPFHECAEDEVIYQILRRLVEGSKYSNPEASVQIYKQRILNPETQTASVSSPLETAGSNCSPLLLQFLNTESHYSETLKKISQVGSNHYLQSKNINTANQRSGNHSSTKNQQNSCRTPPSANL